MSESQMAFSASLASSLQGDILGIVSAKQMVLGLFSKYSDVVYGARFFFFPVFSPSFAPSLLHERAVFMTIFCCVFCLRQKKKKKTLHMVGAVC